ncbi:MAG: methyltransferase [Clostridia bacterium]|nr:methyltransferase [Clostridia bacterium]
MPSKETTLSINASLTLRQLPSGLTFGTDAYLLAAFIKPKPKGRAVELGCGTGVISLLCAAYQKFKAIDAYEIQESYAGIAQKNCTDNSLDSIVNVRQQDIRTLRPTDACREADAVFANPPYMKTTSGKRNEADEKYYARHEVFGTITDFCECGSRMLKTGGSFYCVWRPDRITDLFCALRGARLEPKRITFVFPDTASEPAVVLVESCKGGSSGAHVTKPLVIYRDAPGRDPRQTTEDFQKVYETCTLY